jgi:hypothetical protein
MENEQRFGSPPWRRGSTLLQSLTFRARCKRIKFRCFYTIGIRNAAFSGQVSVSSSRAKRIFSEAPSTPRQNLLTDDRRTLSTGLV